jgi:hypothetical protein
VVTNWTNLHRRLAKTTANKDYVHIAPCTCTVRTIDYCIFKTRTLSIVRKNLPCYILMEGNPTFFYHSFTKIMLDKQRFKNVQ